MSKLTRRQLLLASAGTAAVASLPGLPGLGSSRPVTAFIPAREPLRAGAEQVLAGLPLARTVPVATSRQLQQAAGRLAPGEAALSLLGTERTRALRERAPHARILEVSAGERFTAEAAPDSLHLALWSACEQAGAWACTALGPRSATLAFTPELLTDAPAAWHFGFTRAGGTASPCRPLESERLATALAEAASADVLFTLASGEEAVAVLRAAREGGLTSRVVLTGWALEPAHLERLGADEVEGAFLVSTWQESGALRSGRAALGDRMARTLRGEAVASPRASLWRFDARQRLQRVVDLGTTALHAAHLPLDWSMRSGGLDPYFG